MEEFQDFESLDDIIQASAEQLNIAIEEAKIPDIEPLQYTDRHYHYIGKRGEIDGGYFIRTRSTFNLSDYDLVDLAENDQVVSPVVCSQIFGVEKDGNEVPIVSIDIDFDSEEDDGFEPVSIELNPEWAKLIDTSQFTPQDMEGYHQLFSVIYDVHNYGLTQDAFKEDVVRISDLLDEAGRLSRDSLGQEVEYYHLFAHAAGFCAIESTYRGSYIDRRISAADFTDKTEAAAQILSWGNTRLDEDTPRVQPVIPPETPAIEALRSLRYARLAVETFSVD